MERDDDGLVRAAQAGDDAAFDRLVAHHYPQCLRFAWRQLGNRADAEDVVQESLLRAYRGLARCAEPARFRGWLMTIVVNECRSRAARERRRSWLMRRWWRGEPAANGSAPPTVSQHDAEQLMRTLPAPLREAFLLKHLEDFTYEEMATMTGAGVSALKMRVKRATDLLAERIREERNV